MSDFFADEIEPIELPDIGSMASFVP